MQELLKKVCEVLEIPESVIYILGMQETDVPVSRKNVYDMLFPSIRSMALQIVSTEHRQFIEKYDVAV